MAPGVLGEQSLAPTARGGLGCPIQIGGRDSLTNPRNIQALGPSGLVGIILSLGIGMAFYCTDHLARNRHQVFLGVVGVDHRIPIKVSFVLDLPAPERIDGSF